MADDNKCQIGLDPIKMGRMFEAVDDIRENVKDIKKHVKEQNGRVCKLENWRWYVMGFVAAVAVALKIFL